MVYISLYLFFFNGRIKREISGGKERDFGLLWRPNRNKFIAQLPACRVNIRAALQPYCNFFAGLLKNIFKFVDGILEGLFVFINVIRIVNNKVNIAFQPHK